MAVKSSILISMEDRLWFNPIIVPWNKSTKRILCKRPQAFKECCYVYNHMTVLLNIFQFHSYSSYPIRSCKAGKTVLKKMT